RRLAAELRIRVRTVFMEVSRPAEHASAYDSANPKIGASNQNTADLFTLAGGCDFSATLRRRQNAYQHFRKQAPPALYRAAKSCSNCAKSAGPNRPAIQGERDRHEARHRDCGNHEARGHRDP